MKYVRMLSVVLSIGVLQAQTPAPSFTRAGVTMGKDPSQSIQPGDLISIYGEHLAPPGPCTQPLLYVKPYPIEACNTHVTVAGIPAGLLFVGDKQINLQAPRGVPSSGDGDIQVIVSGVSSAPISVLFGIPKVMLSLQGPAYVHMPIWVKLDRPGPYSQTNYPYSLQPENFGGGSFEVRRNGVVLKPIEIGRSGARMRSGLLNGSIAPFGAPKGRLPLHLEYRFDVPGKYEIRFTGTRLIEPNPKAGIQRVKVQESDWTEIEVLPFSDAQRRRWVQEQVANMPATPGELIGDFIPNMLAYPDANSLAAILPLLYQPEGIVRRFTESSLAMFDAALVTKQLSPMALEKGPTEEIVRFADQDGGVIEGGHAALLARMPQFLKSQSAAVQSGSLQFLMWIPNHDWGKNAEIETRRRSLILGAAPALFQSEDAGLLQVLALALGSVKSDESRAWLQKMIDSGKSVEQARICLGWISGGGAGR